jgi:hypothetical protein
MFSGRTATARIKAALRSSPSERSPQSPSRETGQVEASGDFAHLSVGDFFCLVQSLVGRRQDHIFQQLGIAGVHSLRVNLDGRQRAVTLGRYFDGASAARGLDGATGQILLNLFNLLLHPRSLFHEFADTGHVMGGLSEFLSQGDREMRKMILLSFGR